MAGGGTIDDDAALAREARLFARYLVGQAPTDALVARYVAANRALFTEAPAPPDVAIVAFVRRHPWSTGLLDAASGILRPGGPLRNKILLMAAILETTPEFADRFLPRQIGPLALVIRVGVAGVVAVTEVLLGAALYAVAARGRP